MTDNDLDQIEARAKALRGLAGVVGSVFRDDIPALVREIRRLRAVANAAQDAISRYPALSASLAEALALLDATPPAAGDSEAK